MEIYETVVGMEVHVEMLTASKVFCSCDTTFGADANTHTCPVCLGLPGALPVLNKEAVELTIRAALALNCNIAGNTQFDRKNYYYPDLVKGYQISQYLTPIGYDGYIDIEVGDEVKRVRIKRVHLEEETGKMIHAGDDITSSDHSLMDFNRSGIGLMEIVTEADIRTSEEAKAYLTKLRNTLLSIRVSDCKMEEGSMRCEANISIRPLGSNEYGNLCEIKNVSSFKAVAKAIDFEAKRQADILDSGLVVTKETRHWDESKGETVFMRSKGDAADYRYFPEPDLVPFSIDKEWIEKVQKEMPMTYDEKCDKLMNLYSLSGYEANLILSNQGYLEFFEECARLATGYKAIVNWLLGEVSAKLNADGITIADCRIKPSGLVELVKLIDCNIISGKIAKDVFVKMYEEGSMPGEIVEKCGLVQISDDSALLDIINKVLDSNGKIIDEIRAGKDRAAGFLVGQIMKETKGMANPAKLNELLKIEVEKRL